MWLYVCEKNCFLDRLLLLLLLLFLLFLCLFVFCTFLSACMLSFSLHCFSPVHRMRVQGRTVFTFTYDNLLTCVGRGVTWPEG